MSSAIRTLKSKAEAARDRFEQSATVFEKVQGEFSSLQKAASHAGSDPTFQHRLAIAFQQVQAAHSQAVTNLGAFTSYQRKMTLLEDPHNNGTFTPLVAALMGGGSFSSSLPVLEKDSKGGSSTSVPKRYAYSLSFGGSAYQSEYLPDEWIRADEKAKTGDVEVEMAVDADGSIIASKDNRTFTQGPSVLGDFVGFLRISDVPKHFRSGIAASPGAGLPSARDLLSQAAKALQQQQEQQGPKTMPFIATRSTSPLFDGVSVPLPKAPSSAPASGSAQKPSYPEDFFSLALLYQPPLGDIGAAPGVNPILCKSEDMEALRRTYVFPVCPGITPPSQELHLYLKALALNGTNATPSPSLVAFLRAIGAPASTGNALAERIQVRGRDWNAIPKPGDSEREKALRDALWASLPASFTGGAKRPPPVAIPTLVTDEHSSLPLFGRVLHVEEDGLCAYKVWVESSLACNRQVSRYAKKEALLLKQAYGL